MLNELSIMKYKNEGKPDFNKRSINRIISNLKSQISNPFV